QLYDALRDIRAGSAAGESALGAAPPLAVPLRLFVTVSLIANRARQYVDSTGEAIGEIDHRGTMAFAGKDLRSPDTVAALALAARSSASFPVAFEPSWLPVQTAGEPAASTDVQHPDMTDYAWWDGSGYALDGGLVLNRPLRPALRAVAQQPATRAVRRLM